MHNSNTPKVNILVWTDLSEDQVMKLEELTDSESINNFFIKVFNLEPNTKRTTILCDLYYYALHFAHMNKFNHEQISTLISIIKNVHEMCIQTPYENMNETYKYFKALILKHSLSRPPHNLRIFTADTTKKVTDYVVDTYFRHYKMYKYIFTPTIDFNLKFTFDGMTPEVPKIEEEQVVETTETNNQQDQKQENVELVEIRKLIQAYVKDEVQKLQTTAAATDGNKLRPPVDKHRSAKSSSSKTSKSHSSK